MTLEPLLNIIEIRTNGYCFHAESKMS